MRVLTVLNSKSRQGLAAQEYHPRHVYALQDQLKKWAPRAEFLCLTDTAMSSVNCIALRYSWPGWWAKMEMFRHDVPGDFLFLDLDTVIRGPLDDILAVRDLTMLRDFYRDGVKLKEGLGSGVMYVPAEERAQIWDFWMCQPQLQMRVYPKGDQHLLEKFWLNRAARWQDKVPGQIVSWKVNCRNGVPADARIIAFHGIPRPWAVSQFSNLYR